MHRVDGSHKENNNRIPKVFCFVKNAAETVPSSANNNFLGPPKNARRGKGKKGRAKGEDEDEEDNASSSSKDISLDNWLTETEVLCMWFKIMLLTLLCTGRILPARVVPR